MTGNAEESLSSPASGTIIVRTRRAKGPLLKTKSEHRDNQAYTTKPIASKVIEMEPSVTSKKRRDELVLFTSDDVPSAFLDEQVLEKKRAAKQAAASH